MVDNLDLSEFKDIVFILKQKALENNDSEFLNKLDKAMSMQEDLWEHRWAIWISFTIISFLCLFGAVWNDAKKAAESLPREKKVEIIKKVNQSDNPEQTLRDECFDAACYFAQGIAKYREGLSKEKSQKQ